MALIASEEGLSLDALECTRIHQRPKVNHRQGGPVAAHINIHVDLHATPCRFIIQLQSPLSNPISHSVPRLISAASRYASRLFFVSSPTMVETSLASSGVTLTLTAAVLTFRAAMVLPRRR